MNRAAFRRCSRASSLYASLDDLEVRSGKCTAAGIRRWLDTEGVPYEVNAGGWPVVLIEDLVPGEGSGEHRQIVAALSA